MPDNDLQKVFERIQIRYTYAQSQKWILKPLAWTLYQVWKEIDKKEKVRKPWDG